MLTRGEPIIADLEPLVWLDAREIADAAVFSQTNQHLSDVEMKVLQSSWEEKTYEDMAKAYGYSAEYLNKDVGNKLWRKLSIAIGERVTKKNFKEALRRCRSADSQSEKLPEIGLDLPFPEGSVALESPLYIERPDVEPLCYGAVLKPGALIRIKAPKLMGKTSLMLRLLSYAKNHQCQIVYLDLQSIDRAILTDLDKFLRWLCLMVGRQLKVENQLHQYWDTDILGSNDNCTAYFEDYLLAKIESPLVLGLDDVDRLFPYSAIVEDFLGLLRSWHEKGKISDRWQHLRLAISHSTEAYIPLDINQSPFNAGIPIELKEFEPHQIQHLAGLHHLNWQERECHQLMQLLGGHPYLIRLALYEIARGNTSLPDLLQTASTEAGIFGYHLRRHLEILQRSPELAQTFKQVVQSPDPIELNSMQMYQLHSLGLVERLNNQAMPRCTLYQDYFARVLT
ncbi:MAG: AAA-like domain-containing protein [Leptolyngbyaceae cyanobacterium]